MPKPIAVLVADAHCHPHRDFNTYDDTGASSRVMLTVEALKVAFTYAKEHNCPLISLGDLLHVKTHVPVEVVRPLLNLFHHTMDPPPVWLLVGNHERPDRFSRENTLWWLQATSEWRGPNVTVVNEPCSTPHILPGIMTYWLPWEADQHAAQERLRELLMAADPDTPRVLFGHGCVDGAKADNGYPLSNPNMTPETLCCASYNAVWFGDLHAHQEFAPNGRYVGALIPQNFGERNNPSGFVVLFDDLSWQRMPVPAPRWVYHDQGDVAAQSTVTEIGVEFSRADPQAVAQAVMAAEPKAPAVNIDLTSIDSMLGGYIETNPLPEGVTYELVRQFLIQALGTLT